MEKKTVKINLNSIKDSDGWADLCWSLGICKFGLTEDDEPDDKALYDIFEYGEYADLEIIVDEDLNIVGGKIIPFKEWKK